MIVIQGHVRVQAADLTGLKELARPLIEATRAEPGCQGYAFAEDVLEPGLVHIAEQWADQASLDAHNKTPHLAAFSAALPRFQIMGLKVVAYETTGGRTLIGG